MFLLIGCHTMLVGKLILIIWGGDEGDEFLTPYAWNVDGKSTYYTEEIPNEYTYPAYKQQNIKSSADGFISKSDENVYVWIDSAENITQVRMATLIE
ncbi:MAG: hypothetical protein NC222_06090 [Staphylococcus sp.]|nr:hypothetical protein [Staphylococcus sp.]